MEELFNKGNELNISIILVFQAQIKFFCVEGYYNNILNTISTGFIPIIIFTNYTTENFNGLVHHKIQILEFY